MVSIKLIRSDLKDSRLLNDYQNLILKNANALNDVSRVRLLKYAILFLNEPDCNIQKLGYRIIVCYANLFNDYKPLFDVAINKGLIPISKHIENDINNGAQIEERFLNLFMSVYQSNFEQNGIFLSYGQKSLIDFANHTTGNVSIVAPTSYGKSELMINKIYNNLNNKICVIVPSKALLAQTKKRIVEHPDFAQNVQRVITHPEMYRGDEQRFVAVLTQERLLRLLQKNRGLFLDVVLIDEAHNMFGKDNRAQLLTQVILILYKRNSELKLNFFTPFISDANNLTTPFADYSVTPKETTEYIKTEKFYIADLTIEHKLSIYDQFLNKHIECEGLDGLDDIGFVKNYKASKNIVYINRPIHIERFANKLSQESAIINFDISEITTAISDFIHPEYNLINCISKGVLYHHGGMPEVVRLYVEDVFTHIAEMSYIVTNSTLLEGVNIPAEKIFLVTNKIGKHLLSKSQFKNLIGRVCRFKEVFSSNNGNLNLLEPQIYLLKGEYAPSNANLYTYIEKHARIDIAINDEVGNVLLKRDNFTEEQNQELKKAIEYVENIEPNTIQDNSSIDIVTSEIARLCFSNNVYDFDIKLNETKLVNNLAQYNQLNNNIISNQNQLIEAIFNVFLNNIEVNDSVARLSNESARNYYAMLFAWRIEGYHYKRMISQLLNHWQGREDKIIYVGSRWGEIPLSPMHKKENYIDLSTKTQRQIVNLAIVRIKEEQDFIDNSLVKYVEILNELELIDLSLYSKFKYGSSDSRVISLLRNGLSIELAKTITDPIYSNYISIDTETDEVHFDNSIIDIMETQNVNKILCFEMKFHV